jgi:hypothetical protein
VSAARALGAIAMVVPVTGALVLLLGHLAYRVFAHDTAARLRTRAQLFERASKRPELIAGLRYAADQIDPRSRPMPTESPLEGEAGPTCAELQQAGVELRVSRLSAELEERLSSTGRGRLAVRLARWYARVKR